MKLHSKALDPAQKKALRRVAAFATERGFHLAGGTAVALQLGHRKSVDLDWFTPEVFNEPASLAREMAEASIPFQFQNEGRGALHGAIDGVRVSFLEYRYPFLVPPSSTDINEFKIASLDDLAAIKLSTILQRGARKDFVDFYALGKKHASLEQMLQFYELKYGARDFRLVLHAVMYTVDAEKEPMPKMLWKVGWPEMIRSIRKWVAQWESDHR